MMMQRLRELGSAHLGRVINVGLRGSSLVFRFLLSLYVIKYLGLEAAGIYGLALGVIAFAPVLAALGLNYYLGRDMVGATESDAVALLKTRLVLSLLITLTLGLLALTGCWIGGYWITPIYALIFVLACFEVYANDIHVSLIALEMPVPATVLVAVRLALWVPFVIAAGILFPELRTIEVVFTGFLLSYTVYLGLLCYFLRHWPLREALSMPLRTDWLRDRLKQSWLIFFSDIGMVGFNQIDRYIVSFMLGLRLTGLYTFYWSLANSLQTLVGTAIVDFALPAIYKAYHGGSVEHWRRELRAQLLRAMGYAAVIAVAIYGASEVLIDWLGMSEVAEYRIVLVLLLLAAVLRSASDLFSIGLRTVHLDVQYSLINLGSLVLSSATTFALIYAFGFVGVGIAALSSAIIVSGVRLGVLVRFARRVERASPIEPADGCKTGRIEHSARGGRSP